MRVLLITLLLLLPLPALAEFVDAYGNPVFPNESYRQLPGGAAFRDTNGRIHYEYVRPALPPPASATTPPPAVQTPRHGRDTERYSAFEKVPDSPYRDAFPR